MTEVHFYHLTRTGLDQALPRLLGRTLLAGQRAVVLCSSAQRVAELDDLLWACRDPDWLPHGTAADGEAELQPIWLTTEDSAPNGAGFLFQLDGLASARPEDYARVLDLFDGNDEQAVGAARERWTACNKAGHSLVYWQQGPQGWERKGASS